MKSSGFSAHPTQRAQAPGVGQVQNICEHKQGEDNNVQWKEIQV